MSQTHPVSSGLSSTVGLRIFTWSSHSSSWKGRLSQKTSISNCCLVTRVEWAPTIDGLHLLNRGWQTHPVLPGLSSSVGLRIGTLVGKVVSLLGEAMNWHIFDVDSATAYAPCQSAVTVWRPSCLQLLLGHSSNVGAHGRWSVYPEVFEGWCSCLQVHGVATGFIVGNFFKLSRLALTINGSIHHSFDVARSSGTLWGPHMFFSRNNYAEANPLLECDDAVLFIPFLPCTIKKR